MARSPLPFRRAYKRSILVACGAAMALAMAPGHTAMQPVRLTASAAGSLRWWIVSAALSKVDGADPVITRDAFDTPSTTVVGSIAAGWRSRPAAIYSSYASFQTAVSGRQVPAGVAIVMYDNENWSFTPLTEQQNPAAYEGSFCELAHANGYLCATAPAFNLVKVQSWYDSTKSTWSQYLSHGFATFSARYADIFDVQAQWQELDVTTYSAVVRQASSQALAANSSVTVLSGLSTSLGVTEVNSQQMYAATQATMPGVAGYWLNVPQRSSHCPNCVTTPNTQAAVDYLHMLY